MSAQPIYRIATKPSILKQAKEARVLFGLQDKFFNKSKKPSDPFKPFPNGVNPKTGEVGGPTGPEPTRYGDWERRGRCSDF
uniref:Succinate dehydrogenase assembly factor 4, mitochondrial n=1 Tax=Megaselia scalaris TaxID=36166 RepID=T1GBE6_MEGSC